MAACRGNVIVVGGSLGGLNAAMWLKTLGYSVTVFERSKSHLSGRGAGIALNPYTILCLPHQLNVDVRTLAVRTPTMRILHNSTETTLSVSSCFTSYNSLYQSFLSCLGKHNYLLDHNVVAIHQDDVGVKLRTANDATHMCDFVVCADGTNSTSRSLLGINHNPVYAGYVAWRGTLPASTLSMDAARYFTESLTYFLQSDFHILAYSIPAAKSLRPGSDKEIYVNWLWYRNVKEGPPLDFLLTDNCGQRRSRSVPPGSVHPKHIQKLKSDAATIPEPLRTLIKLTENPFIQAIYDQPTDKMVVNRCCILGDAAFTVRPHTAIGTAKAAEDGRQLAICIEECHGDFVAALALWEKRQLKLGHQCLLRSREVGLKLQQGRRPSEKDGWYGLYDSVDSHKN